MITREVYLEYAKKNMIPIQLLYEYYNKFNLRTEINFSLESFEQIFMNYLSRNALTLQGARDYFDREYQINKAYDRNNNFITLF